MNIIAKKIPSQILRQHIKPLRGDSRDYDHLLEAIGQSQVVMIGEATHGTEEFYKFRAELTKKLIQDKNFSFVAVEGDWPDTYRVHRYATCGKHCQDKTAKESLGDFQRFPRWMWRNGVVEEFVEWLKEHNTNLIQKAEKSNKKPELVGFYGLDLYALFSSAQKVIEYLEVVDPELAEKARKRYGTLDVYRGREAEYGYDVVMHIVPSRENEVVSMLVDMVKKGPEYVRKLGGYNGDENFWATENAHVVRDAERYYRNSYMGGHVTWNLRDTHMMETLVNLMKFYESYGRKDVKAVVWAHNSHLGDARATKYGLRELNIGQLIREKYGTARSFNVGFTTFNGTVTAARRWGGKRQVFTLNDADSDTYEYLLHETSPDNFIIITRSENPELVDGEAVAQLKSPRYERMIGVQYCKDTERPSHYIKSCLPEQFDAIVHIDKTTALIPLDSD